MSEHSTIEPYRVPYAHEYTAWDCPECGQVNAIDDGEVSLVKQCCFCGLRVAIQL